MTQVAFKYAKWDYVIIDALDSNGQNYNNVFGNVTVTPNSSGSKNMNANGAFGTPPSVLTPTANTIVTYGTIGSGYKIIRSSTPLEIIFTGTNY